ncbi:MAG TPA: ABC transporter permease [Microbacteriaceae bacterium]
MIKYVARRISHMVVVLFGVSIAVFALVHLVPGDPIKVALGTRYNEETYQALLVASGLDRPLLEQYFSYIFGLLQGDFGISFRSGAPVAEVLFERVPATLSLATFGIVLAILVAIPLGVIAALNDGKAADGGIRVFSQIGVSLPDFWTAMLLILLFSATWQILPSSGYVPFTEDPWQWLRHLAIPGMTIGLIASSIITRYVRSSVLEIINSDHVRTAESKGLSRSRVIRQHILRNALPPIMTITGVQFATMLGGVIVVEVVVAWPGLGRLVFDAVATRDYPVIQGVVMLIAVAFLLINLLVDVLQARLDPRVLR